jgi:hypothetical protein
MRTTALLAFLAAPLGCVEVTVAPTESAPAAITTHTLLLDEGRLAFDGRSIDFPATPESLAQLFGPPSRTIDGTNVIDVWDDLGVRSYRRAGTNQVTEVDVDFQPDTADVYPRSGFRGHVVVQGGRIGECSTEDELRAAGLRHSSISSSGPWSVRLGRFVVYADCDDGVSSVGLGWRGPDVHVPGPPLGPDEPFSANSRDYGFPFDEVIREVERRGNVSVLRHEIHGHGGTVGRSMFACGAIGELARRQGYGFVVTLDDRAVEGGWDDDPRIVETIVGFTRDEQPDVAREFPADFDPQRTYDVMPADLVIDALGDWPDGGRAWATAAR